VDLVVWKGFRNIDVWEYTSGPAGEWMKLKDDRVCEWKRSKDANAVIVNGKEYSLEGGRMLLLSLDGEEVRVQQLDYDLSSLGSSDEEIEQALSALGETNDAIREFVDAAQPIEP